MGGDLRELDTLYQYDPIEDKWVLLEDRLRTRRTSFTAILLPQELNCINNFRQIIDHRLYGQGENRLTNSYSHRDNNYN